MLSLLSVTAESAPILWENFGFREGFDLGFFTLRFYALAYITGILLAYWHLSKMIKAPGAPMAQDHVDDLFFYCTLGVILGGRLGYVLFYQPELLTDFSGDGLVSWRALRLWDGGMSFHGGVLGVLVAIAWVSWRRKLSFLRVCDYIAVVVPFGMLFGRLANFTNGELWGRPTEVPWGMVFPMADDLARHPSQLYQASLEGLLLMIVMLALFWKTRARYRTGFLVGVFTVGIGIARFTVEFFREPDAHLREFAMETGLSMGQWLTIPLILVGLGFAIWSWTRPETGSGAKLAERPQSKADA